MAVTFDNVGVGGSSTAGSISFNHTVNTSSNNILIVGISSSGDSSVYGIITGTQYNGVALTQVTGSPFTEGTGTSARTTFIFYVKNTATGTHGVVVNFSGSPAGMYGNSVSFNGVSQTTPFGTALTNGGTSVTSTSITSTSTTNDVVFAVLAARTSSTVTAGGSQNSEWNTKTTTNIASMGTYQTGGTSQVSSFSWTGADNGASIAVPILNSGGGATPNGNFLRFM